MTSSELQITWKVPRPQIVSSGLTISHLFSVMNSFNILQLMYTCNATTDEKHLFEAVWGTWPRLYYTTNAIFHWLNAANCCCYLGTFHCVKWHLWGKIKKSWLWDNAAISHWVVPVQWFRFLAFDLKKSLHKNYLVIYHGFYSATENSCCTNKLLEQLMQLENTSSSSCMSCKIFVNQFLHEPIHRAETVLKMRGCWTWWAPVYTWDLKRLVTDCRSSK